jgi:1-acyl-sn-glycerol-3-phosphate acyltransferase
MNRIEEIIASVGGLLKAAGFLLLALVLTPVAFVWKKADPAHTFVIPRLFHRLALCMLGIKIKVSGTPSTDMPVLFAANHASYLDIIVLGSLLPAAFIAKSEVAGWPLFGFLAKMQDTIFIERRSTRAADQKTQLQAHFAKRRNIAFFPEGTSSDGLTALPFKSSLFATVEESVGTPITVQPVSITCTELDGYPILLEERALYAWYGDMTLMPHLRNVFRRGHFTVEVIFHPPLTTQECADRKVMAATCQERVTRGIEASLSGRGTGVPALPTV